LLALRVSKAAIAKITGVDRATLYLIYVHVDFYRSDGGEPRRIPPRGAGLPGVPRVGGLPRSTAVAVSTATILCRVCGVSRSVPARSRTCLTLGGPGCCPVPAGGASREVWAARHHLCAGDSRRGITATGAGNMLPTQARPRWVVMPPMPVRGRHACRTNGMAWARGRHQRPRPAQTHGGCHALDRDVRLPPQGIDGRGCCTPMRVFQPWHASWGPLGPPRPPLEGPARAAPCRRRCDNTEENGGEVTPCNPAIIVTPATGRGKRPCSPNA
jgi:hypothetical protein